MGNLVLALAIVFGGWWLMRKFASSQPAQIRSLARRIAGGAIMAVGALLMARGQATIAISLFVLGAGLIGETSLFPDGIQWPGAKPEAGPGPRPEARPPTPRRTAMSREEALAVLGLKPGAGPDDVRAAYKRLMKDFHPDRGGSDYLAAQINQAKDVLIQELGATT